MRPPLIAAALVFALSAPCWGAGDAADSGARNHRRVAPDRDSLEVKTRAGDEKTLRLPADAKVARVVAASLADLKPGVYVGVAAVPGEGGG